MRQHLSMLECKGCAFPANMVFESCVNRFFTHVWRMTQTCGRSSRTGAAPAGCVLAVMCPGMLCQIFFIHSDFFHSGVRACSRQLNCIVGVLSRVP